MIFLGSGYLIVNEAPSGRTTMVGYKRLNNGLLIRHIDALLEFSLAGICILLNNILLMEHFLQTEVEFL